MAAAARALAQRLGIGVQVEHGSVCLEPFPVERADDDAAAGREHDAGPRHELGQRRLFAIAEDRLTLDLEDHRDRDAEPALELRVGVDECEPEPSRERAPECRLAGARQSHEKEVAAMQLHRSIVREFPHASPNEKGVTPTRDALSPTAPRGARRSLHRVQRFLHDARREEDQELLLLASCGPSS